MSSFSSLDALASERRFNRQLFRVTLLVAAVGVVGIYFAWTTPKSLDLHISPSLQAGDTVSVSHGVAPIAAPNLYAFAYYVWQQINRWQVDGAKDYGKQIYDFQSYLTPRCVAQLRGDLEARSGASELHMRTRYITEIPGFGFQEARVVPDGGAWTVLLDMQVSENFRGQPVKDAHIRYPIRVVRFDVDRQRNPFQLAVDCFGKNRPERLDIASPSATSLNATTLEPAALPSVSTAPVSTPTTAPSTARSATSATDGAPR